MAKYVIDVPDEAVEFMGGYMNFLVEPKIKDGQRRRYVLRVNEEDVSIYTEPDRKAIEDEVWEFAKKFMDDMGVDDLEVVNGDTIKRYFAMTYQEARGKYESWKKKKEEIHVGDEVQYSLAGYEYTFIVFGKENDTLYGMRSDCEDGLDDIYDCWESCYKLDNTLRKTGRHFDEVERLLKKIEED